MTDRLLSDITSLRGQIATVAGDPVDLTLRAHEILEDAQRDHLSGTDDQGAHASYAMTWADVQVTRTVWNELRGPITSRNQQLFAQAMSALDRLNAALLAVRVNGGGLAPVRWLSRQQASPLQRATINAAMGAALEVVAQEPGLLEVPATSQASAAIASPTPPSPAPASKGASR